MHPTNYQIIIDSINGKGGVTRYHPERPEEKNDLIRVKYKGMKIELKFEKPLSEIAFHKDSLQKYFSHLALYKIHHTVKAPGWNIAPKTPRSSNRENKCIQFIKAERNKLSFEINWETFTFSGTSNSKFCLENLQIEDSSLPESCYVGVDQKINLTINANSIILE